MRLVSLLAFLVLGCNGKDDGEGDTDTDTDTDSDTDTDTDTDSDTDTDTDLLEGILQIGADVAPPKDGLVVAVEFDYQNLNADLGTPIDSYPVSGLAPDLPVPFEFELPSEVSDANFWTPHDDAPAFEVAIFLVGAYSDASGDGVPGGGDIFIGSTNLALGFARGEITGTPSKLGAVEGWNVMRIDLASGPSEYTPVADFDVLTVTSNLLPKLRTDLGAEVVSGVEDGATISLISMVEGMGGDPPVDRVLASEEVTSGSATFPWPIRPPDEDHFLSPKGSPLSVANYGAFCIDDANGNGDLDKGEAIYATSMGAGADARELVFQSPLSLAAGVFVELTGQEMGFGLRTFTDGKPPEPVAWKEGLVLDQDLPD